MTYLECIASWFSVGLISVFLGMLSDWILFKRNPKISMSHFIFCILMGYVSMLILFESVYNGLKK